MIIICCGDTVIANNYSPKDAYSILLKEKIYDGFNNGPINEGYEYDVNINWTSTVINHPYYGFNQPHLSWKVSGILNGLYYAYKATGDDVFLLESLSMYEELLKRRDDNENRIAWDGKIYPLWGSTSRYNGATFPLIDKDNNKIGSIDFYGINHDKTMVAIKQNILNNKCFDLIIKHNEELYEINNVTINSLQERICDEIEWSYYGSPLENNRVVTVSLDYENTNILPVECELTLIDSINVPTVIHSALILKPLVQTYIEMKSINHSLTNKYKKTIEECFDALLELTWETEGDYGYFRNPLDSPTYLGGKGMLPWNQQIVLVDAMALYAEEEKNDYYKEIIRKWCTCFLQHVEKTNTGYLWKYWEDSTGTVTWYESTNYGGIDMASIYSIYTTGLAFSDQDIDEIVKTISLRIIGTDGKISSRIDGKVKRADMVNSLFRYLPYSKYVPEIIDILKEQEMNWSQASALLYYYDQSALN